MQQQGVEPNLSSYNSTIDACSATGQWQQAIALLREIMCAGLKPDIISYNRVINACQNGEQWQLTLELLAELKAAGLQPNEITYKCVIDALHAASEHQKAEVMYIEMLQHGLALQHWSKRHQGMLDFHDCTVGMAAAAVRIVLRDMLHTANSIMSSSSDAYVHDVSSDLHIITGHAMHREHRDGSVLQPIIIDMLKQLGLQCSVDARNKGLLIVTSSELKGYVARVSTE
jgi:pentatricopeptide repeat protein